MFTVYNAITDTSVVGFGLSTDELPVNEEGKPKQIDNGSFVLVFNPSTDKLEFKVFDEENNTWRP